MTDRNRSNSLRMQQLVFSLEIKVSLRVNPYASTAAPSHARTRYDEWMNRRSRFVVRCSLRVRKGCAPHMVEIFGVVPLDHVRLYLRLGVPASLAEIRQPARR